MRIKFECNEAHTVKIPHKNLKIVLFFLLYAFYHVLKSVPYHHAAVLMHLILL